MTDANFPLMADSDFEDLPRTLRREKEARAREAREARERRDRERRGMDASLGDPPAYLARTRQAPAVYGDDPVPAAVRRFDVPFIHLAKFFLKAVLAAIPALILLGVLLYYAGKGLEAFYPELVRMKITITFPDG
ncbi:hypothetical protein [Hyphomicrobium sp.]|uniref:hypothetical protein n=1 Tax=Hyphomicrobium sp. TaxID=82 RepID=UPI0025C2BB01|nr:hypothetical protein [Hyphomicrobium sp.]MCC7251696.1 hypothetical protein [Hyphomicrobium sp.]